MFSNSKLKSLYTSSDQRSKKAKQQILISLGVNISTISVSFIYVPLLISYMDTERYGLWLTLTSIVGWFTFFDGGLGNGLKNKLIEVIAKNDFTLARSYISTAYAFFSLIFGGLLAIVLFIIPFIDLKSFYNTSIVPEDELLWFTVIAFVFFFIRFILKVIEVVSEANLEPSLAKIIMAVASIISLAAVYLIKVFLEPSLIYLCFVLSSIPVLVLIIFSLYLFNYRYIKLKPEFDMINWALLPDIWKVGTKFLFIQISSLVLFSLSNFLILKTLGADSVTEYNIVYKYYQLPLMVYSIIITPLWSSAADAFQRNDLPWIQKVLKRYNYLSVGLIFATFLMFALSGWFFKLWVGEEVIVSEALNLAFLLFVCSSLLISPYSHIINGMGKLKVSVRITVFKILLYIPLSLYFLNSFLGVAGSTVVTLLFALISGPFYIYQVHGLISGAKLGKIWNK